MRSTLIKAPSLISLRLSLCQAIWGSQRNIIILVTANIYSVLAPSKNLLNPVTMCYLMGFLLPPSEDTYRCATGLRDVGDLPKVTQLDHPNSSAGVRALGGPGAPPSPASHPPHPAHCIRLNDLSQCSAHPTVSLPLLHLCTGCSPGERTKEVVGKLACKNKDYPGSWHSCKSTQLTSYQPLCM